MNPQLKWKFIFIAAVVIICFWSILAVPRFPTSMSQLSDNVANRIPLGLDLKGGSHLVLQVKVQDAIGQRTDEAQDDLKKGIRDKNIKVGEIDRVDDEHILVKNVDPSTSGSFHDLIANLLPDWTSSPAAGQVGGYLLAMKPSAVSEIDSRTMEQSVEVIQRRINELGLKEPHVAPTGAGKNEILVELPGEGDPTEAKAVIQAGGRLELHLVLDTQSYPSEAAAQAAHGGLLPPDAEIVPGKPEGTSTSEGQVYYVLQREAIVTGEDLRGANTAPSTQNPGSFDVNFHLSNAGASRFGPFTEANIGKDLAIVLDGKVETAPRIDGRMDDQGSIYGNFTQQSADELAKILSAGALPAGVTYIQEQTVGPSLGSDSIRDGVRASVGSLIAVMLFLLIYYRLSGVNAVVALILNLVILVAFMAFAQATLTLPGIAGVILTIGMGVDSNVLVFERIREELRAGKANASAVDIGFDRAFLTIIDTHITTLVSAAFLFLFGTGPVKGFAITLTIGLLANLFTSIYVSRAIFDYHLAHMERQAELSI